MFYFSSVYFNEKWTVIVCQVGEKKQEIQNTKSVYRLPMDKVLLCINKDLSVQIKWIVYFINSGNILLPQSN